MQPLEVQLIQFLTQPRHALPLKYCPGRQLRQLVGEFLQVIHLGSHKRQLVPERYDPSMHSEQFEVFNGSHFEQPAAQMKQVAEFESNVLPDLQAVQTPVGH